MHLLIADTFTASLARLTADEQKAAKTTAFDLQMNPASPGMQLHKLERAKDRNFWSVRVSSDLRLIVHKNDASLLLCYVGHHDAAYRWAEQRKIERHPVTGAAQLVEIRETVREIAIPRYVQTESVEKPVAPVRTSSNLRGPLFQAIPDADLLSYGVPAEWLDDVRRATEDSLFDLAGHLPPRRSVAKAGARTRYRRDAEAARSSSIARPGACCCATSTTATARTTGPSGAHMVGAWLPSMVPTGTDAGRSWANSGWRDVDYLERSLGL